MNKTEYLEKLEAFKAELNAPASKVFVQSWGFLILGFLVENTIASIVLFSLAVLFSAVEVMMTAKTHRVKKQIEGYIARADDDTRS